jgi:hypothetical protein
MRKRVVMFGVLVAALVAPAAALARSAVSGALKQTVVGAYGSVLVSIQVLDKPRRVLAPGSTATGLLCRAAMEPFGIRTGTATRVCARSRR